ncbi:MAG TPA: hypothetical protein VFE89_07390 [Beijerinckiaceae bacterium]|nr:hypothetical protein [Beijerinckiaceae bacterium]
MKVPVIAEIIAGLVSLVSAAGTLWSSAPTNANAIKLLEIESDRQNPLLSARAKSPTSANRYPDRPMTCRAAFTTL